MRLVPAFECSSCSVLSVKQLLMMSVAMMLTLTNTGVRSSGIYEKYSYNDQDSPWSYDANDANGPEWWYTKYPQCHTERPQSPIDIAGQMDASNKLNELTFGNDFFKEHPYTLSNTGHGVEITVPQDAYTELTVNTSRLSYSLSRVDFHWGSESNRGSEHSISGKSYPLEIHFSLVPSGKIFKDVCVGVPTGNALAVVAVFGLLTKESPKTDALDAIINKLDAILNTDTTTEVNMELQKLLPPSDQRDRYFRYFGSLTAPPCCTGFVEWTVLEQPILVSEKQLSKLRSTIFDRNSQLIESNFRPKSKQSNFKIYYHNAKGAAFSQATSVATSKPGVSTAKPAPADKTTKKPHAAAESLSASSHCIAVLSTLVFRLLSSSQ